jgi:peptidoglycan-N-acetylglucosamine deacetylase
VLHANGRGWHTAEALPGVIADLRARGFEFATVSEMLAKGEPVIADSCYERKPGDNARYDKLFPLEPAKAQH